MPDQRVTRTRASVLSLVKELGAFGVVGGSCLLLDIALFQLVYAHLGWGAVTAKLVSTTISTTVAYVAHRHWSFGHRARTGVRRQYLLFVLINGLTLALGLLAVWLVRYPLEHTSPVVLQLANVGSIAVGTVVRYLAYRRWVFVEAAVAHPDLASPDSAPTQRRRVGSTSADG